MNKREKAGAMYAHDPAHFGIYSAFMAGAEYERKRAEALAKEVEYQIKYHKEDTIHGLLVALADWKDEGEVE